MTGYTVELILAVEANSLTDAQVLGERAAKLAADAVTPRSAGVARIVNAFVSDVRTDDEGAE